MPRRAAVDRARVEGTHSAGWEHSSLVQLWGPRLSAYVVASKDRPIFSLGRLPEDARGRARAHDTADRLQLSSTEGGCRWPGRTLDGRAAEQPPVRLGDRQSPDALGRSAPARGLDRAAARHGLEGTLASNSRAGISTSSVRQRPHLSPTGPGFGERGNAAFDALAGMLTPASTPAGDAWILADDEAALRSAPGHPGRLGCCLAAMPTICCGEPIGNSWCPRPSDGASCGRRAYGPARCSRAENSPAPGDGRGPRFRSTPGAAFPGRSRRLSRPRRSRCRWASSVQSRSAGAEPCRNGSGSRTHRQLPSWPNRRLRRRKPVSRQPPSPGEPAR